jgi:CRISPR-associated protein Csm3
MKGKMRSLAEKLTGAPQNQGIGKDVRIHVAKSLEDYEKYWVNPIFGIAPADGNYTIPAPNRLIVRDVPLSPDSATKLESAKTDLPYTEIKWEAAIDRVTSAASPRQIERVPAGAVFAPMELVFNLYLPDDLPVLFPHLITCLALVEDDYIGGHGSRGSGKVAFKNLTLTYKRGGDYSETAKGFANLVELKTEYEAWLKASVKP